MATFNFKTKSNKSAVLTIQGATVTDGCVPAPSPIVTEIASDDDFFTPIRTQSGKISLKGGIEDLEGIIGDNPLSRPVTLTIDSVVVWKGYLQCSAFSQDWCVGPNSLELPIISPLAVADGISMDASNLNYQTFAAFISEMNVKLGNVYSSIVYPSRNTAALQYKFYRKNYATYNREEQRYDTQSYLSILTDICKLFGWQCQERGNKLVFACIDIERGDTDTHEVASDDHKVDYIQGKKSVEVECAIKDFDNSIFRINEENYTESEAESASKTGTGSIDESYTHFYASRVLTGSEIVSAYEGNPRFLEFKNDDTDARCANLIQEKLVKYNPYKHDEGVVGDDTFSTRLAWKLDSGSVICKIKPMETFVPNPTLPQRICISMDLKAAKDCMSEYTVEEVKTALPFYIYFKIGDKYWDENNSTWTTTKTYLLTGIKNGNLIPQLHIALQYGVVYSIPVPNFSGNIDIEIVANGDAKLYALESFDVSLIEDWTIYGLFTDNTSSVKKKHEIGNGFQDDYQISTNLCLKKYSYNKGQTLVVDSSNHFPTSLITNGTRPEIDLANRLKEYYKQTRRKISITVSSVASMLDVQHLHTVDTMTGYACLAQSVNWYDEEIKATFFELP